MGHIYLVVKEQGLENPRIAYVSTIACNSVSLDRMLEAEKIERDRLRKEFSPQRYAIMQYVGGRFAHNSPEGAYLRAHKAELTAEQILARKKPKK